MIMVKKALIAAALVTPGMMAATQAQAQAQVAGIAVADPEAAVANSKAWATARGQIETQYKTQLDQAEARRQAVAKELQPLYAAFQTARAAPGATDASLRPQATAIQTREAAATQELQRLTAPAQRAQAYAIEQISAKLGDAVSATVRAKNISLLLKPDSALFAQPTTDVTAAITTEIDRLVPSVGITPPAGWQPGQNRAGGAGAAPARTTAPVTTRPAGKAPQGR